MLFTNVRVSLAKVENVVNPPQNPVINRNRKLFDGIKLENKPMQKHPKILIMKVARGNAVKSALTTKTDVRKRNTLPTAPPAPTNKICLIIFQIYMIIFYQLYFRHTI